MNLKRGDVLYSPGKNVTIRVLKKLKDRVWTNKRHGRRGRYQKDTTIYTTSELEAAGFKHWGKGQGLIQECK